MILHVYLRNGAELTSIPKQLLSLPGTVSLQRGDRIRIANPCELPSLHTPSVTLTPKLSSSNFWCGSTRLLRLTRECQMHSNSLLEEEKKNEVMKRHHSPLCTVCTSYISVQDLNGIALF